MAFCPNCGSQLNDGAQFCLNCGTQISSAQNSQIQNDAQQPQQPQQQPPYQQPQYQPPVYTPKPKVPGRGFGIASMVLGIIAAVYAFFLILEVISYAI